MPRWLPATLFALGVFLLGLGYFARPVHTAHRPRVELAVGADGGLVSIACGQELTLSSGLTVFVECEGDGPRSEVGP